MPCGHLRDGWSCEGAWIRRESYWKIWKSCHGRILGQLAGDHRRAIRSARWAEGLLSPARPPEIKKQVLRYAQDDDGFSMTGLVSCGSAETKQSEHHGFSRATPRGWMMSNCAVPAPTEGRFSVSKFQLTRMILIFCWRPFGMTISMTFCLTWTGSETYNDTKFEHGIQESGSNYAVLFSTDQTGGP